MNWSLLYILVGAIFAPLLFGIINRTKAFFGGRKGQPLLQTYYDLVKLFRKGAVYSQTTGWIFRAAPVIGCAVTLLILPFLPPGSGKALFSFDGDLFLVIYLIGLYRMFYVLAAMDTGSAFEGMGASREMHFSLFSELALILSLAAIARVTGSLSLSAMLAGLGSPFSTGTLQVILFTGAALAIVLLTENARIPVDDPNTHLELTMIHEVMVLDHSGPDLGLILYTSCLKLWIFASLLVSIVVPVQTGNQAADFGLRIACLTGVALLVGIIESVMARLRLLRVPILTTAASVLAVLSLVIPVR